MEIYELTVHELIEKLRKNEITSEEIVKSYLGRISEKEDDVKAFVSVLENEALENKAIYKFITGNKENAITEVNSSLST